MPTCSILPAVEHREPVAHRERLLLVVRHVDEREPDLLLDLLELDLHLLTELQVERAERLVEQQHLRPIHQRAGERHALPLPTGELGRLAAAEAAEADHLERSSTRARRSSFGTFLTRRPYATFSATVMCGNSA